MPAGVRVQGPYEQDRRTARTAQTAGDGVKSAGLRAQLESARGSDAGARRPQVLHAAAELLQYRMLLLQRPGT